MAKFFLSEKSTRFWSKTCQKPDVLEIIPNYEIIVQELKKGRILIHNLENQRACK